MIFTKIEWSNHTANLWWGCTEIHEGCDNCYARIFSHRYDGGQPLWGRQAPRRKILNVWNELDKFQRHALDANKTHRVFVGSMMDIFEKSMPLVDKDGTTVNGETGDLRKELFKRISDERYPNLLFLLLTKRPSNIIKYIPKEWIEAPRQNVMYGTSVVNQKTFNSLVPQLTKVSGHKFLSVEPQLDQIILDRELVNEIDWIIQGGESGGHKRPFNLEWARSMRDQCKNLEIPYFFKQIDKIQEIPKDLMIREFPRLENKFKRWAA